jgi:hypothetical protein
MQLYLKHLRHQTHVGSQGDQMSLYKNAQNVAQHIFVKNEYFLAFPAEKVAQICRLHM